MRKNYPLTTFQDLGLAAPILKALEEEGYAKPTPIQSRAITPVMEGRDILGIAQTGTGKTAAFALRSFIASQPIAVRPPQGLPRAHPLAHP